MKYNKIVKNGLENNYLISIFFSILLLLVIGCFGIGNEVKGTYSGFGGTTGVITASYNITYYSNYPDSSLETYFFEKSNKREHIVLDNSFDIPTGYEFNGWNTLKDGTGTSYMVNDVIPLTENIELYAQWTLLSDEETNDGSEDDEEIDEPPVDTDDNTDSGEDDMKPEDESDSSSEDSSDTDAEDNTSSDKENEGTSGGTSGNTGGSGSGTGGGSSGSGSGSSNGGNASSGNSSSGNNSGNNNSGSGSNHENNKVNSSTDKNTENNNNFKDNNENISQKVIYNFKFMNDDMEYFTSSCEVISDDMCSLLLPSDSPIKEGYTFTGWSLTKQCISGTVINSSISVNSSNTYYACFTKNIDNSKDVNMNVIITIVLIWLMAGTLIYLSIKRFKKSVDND